MKMYLKHVVHFLFRKNKCKTDIPCPIKIYNNDKNK